MALKITREELDEACDLERRRKELDRESRALKARYDQIADRITEQLQADGKATAKRHGYVLTLVAGTVSVSWKSEFLREVGADRAAELQAAAAATPGPVRLAITPPPPSGEF